MLIATDIAGVAAESWPLLYCVLSEAFEDDRDAFRQALRNEAQGEDAMRKPMRDTGCDRSEDGSYMESAALERLEDWGERVLAMRQAHRMM